MKELLEKAAELGKMIAQSDRFKNLEAARKELDTDKELAADMKALEDIERQMYELQKQSKPIEPDLKHRHRDLSEKVTVNPRMQTLLRAQADFSELMNHVNRQIHTPMIADVKQ